MSLFSADTGFLRSLKVFASWRRVTSKSTEWSTIPACPSLMCLFNRGNTEGTNSSKNFLRVGGELPLRVLALCAY